MHGRHNHHQNSAIRDPERPWSVFVSVPRQTGLRLLKEKKKRYSPRAVYTSILAESAPSPRTITLVASAEHVLYAYGISKSWWGCTVRDDEHLLRGDRRVLVQLQLQKCVSAARESRIPVSKSLRAPDMGYILAYQHLRLHPRHRFCLMPNRRSELRAIVSRRYLTVLTCSSDDQHNRQAYTNPDAASWKDHPARSSTWTLQLQHLQETPVVKFKMCVRSALTHD
jgi:hypothetical protein